MPEMQLFRRPTDRAKQQKQACDKIKMYLFHAGKYKDKTIKSLSVKWEICAK
jgi:hypothetical protein